MDFLSSVVGAEGETRTLTLLPEPDFESGASTSSATSARVVFSCEAQIIAVLVQQGQQLCRILLVWFIACWRLVARKRALTEGLGLVGVFLRCLADVCEVVCDGGTETVVVHQEGIVSLDGRQEFK